MEMGRGEQGIYRSNMPAANVQHVAVEAAYERTICSWVVGVGNAGILVSAAGN